MSRRLYIYLALATGAGLFMTPLIWTLSTALKTSEEIARSPTHIIPAHPTLGNFVAAWHALPLGDYVMNTLFVTVISTVGTVLTASFVAYGFARFEFRTKNILFTILLGTMMLPAQVTMAPVFLIWRSLGAIDTFFPLTVPAFLGGGAFNVFLLRQFFMTIPKDLDEAMHLDGAGPLSVWWRLILPLSTPALATVAIFSFVANWDNFDGPLIYLNSSENYTMSIGLRLFQDTFGTDLGQLMAASFMNLVPILLLFLLAQRYFIKGIATSGMGGR